jgi:nicotinamide phosphoribosyltransferase
MKLSAAKVNGVWIDVCKEPADCPWKRSRAGRLTLSPEFKTYKTSAYNGPSILETVFDNGSLLIDENFDTIRQRD